MPFALVLCLASQVQGQQQKTAPAGQSSPSKAQSRPKEAKQGNSQFTCPDPKAADACKSFAELRKAGDEDVLPSYSGRISLVCFRQQNDEFFILEVTDPSFSQTHFDRLTGKQVPDKDATDDAFGTIAGFAKGIEDETILPIFEFSGKWVYRLGPWFKADEINGSEISDRDHYGISANASQFIAGFRYKNRMEKDIDYSLVIQLSTGRFSEKFTEDQAKFPFSETNGHCSRLPAAGSKTKSQ
ncbi:MAG TPA: hypothetical protein VJO53_04620 [Candidatus Acidoferrales bacterium]|nr:hypothetical protein [Candidatus Acidoferrales bacterium]